MKQFLTRFTLLLSFVLTIASFTTAQVQQNDVIINEFLVNPVSADGKEYVELLVTSSTPVDMRGWRLTDVSSKTTATGATEGHLDFPMQSYLQDLPQGTRIVVVFPVPSGNSNLYALEDTDPSDSLLILFSSAISGSLIASGTIDFSTNENMVLMDSSSLLTPASATIVDYVGTGTNNSLVNYLGAQWYKLTDSIPTGSSGTVTYFTNDRSGGLNNDTSSITVMWKANQPSTDKTPGLKNIGQIFPWTLTSANSGDGTASLLNVSPSEVTLLNTTLFRREVSSQTVRLTINGTSGGALDSVIVTVPNTWTGLSSENVSLGGAFAGKDIVVSGNRIEILSTGLETTPGTVDIAELTTPNPAGAGVEGSYTWNVYTSAASNPAAIISVLPKSRVIIPIQNIRTGGVDGFGNSNAGGTTAVMFNKIVAVEGVVTVEDSILAGITTTSFFIQDGNYGLQVFRSGANSSQLFQRGSKVIVLGNITNFNGITEIVPNSIGSPDFFVEGTGTLPEPLALDSTSQIREQYEGRLVKISGVAFDSVGLLFRAMTSTVGAKFQKHSIYRSLHINTADSLGNIAGQRPFKIIGTTIPPTADIVGVVYHRSDLDTVDVTKRNAYKLAPRDIRDITRYSSLTGLVFNDLSGDGIKDAGEPGLQGWQLNLNGNAQTATTNINGVYTFNGLVAGTYIISQTVQSGWVQTTPGNNGNDTVTVGEGVVMSAPAFGNWKNGRIEGFTYEDNDGDGTFNADVDRISPGPQIFLHSSTLGNFIDTTEADEDGNFSFFGLPAGTYFVTMEATNTVRITDPQPIDGQIYLTTTLSPTSTSFNGRFGYFRLVKIAGFKFFDLTRNGLYDFGLPGAISAEPLIPNWEIYLSLDGTPIDTQLTDENGQYEFTNLGPGIYTVSEEARTRWIQTAPDAGVYTDTVKASGQNFTGQYFGNRLIRRGMKPRIARTNSFWSDSANWEFDVLPNQEDTIDIALGDTILIDANAFSSGFDSLRALILDGVLRFPTEKLLRLRDGLRINSTGSLDVDSGIAPHLKIYGSFNGSGTFTPGHSKIWMLGNEDKVLGFTGGTGKAESQTTFYDLKIDGANTSTASGLLVEHTLALDGNLTIADTAHTITIDNDSSNAVSGTGKISRGTVVRKIRAGDTGDYRFHSSNSKLAFQGVGVPPASVRMRLDTDSTSYPFSQYRVEKPGTVDVVNNSVTVSGLTHFSKWVFGQVGHKDSSGTPIYDINAEETTAKGSFTDSVTLTLEYNPSSLTYDEDSIALYRVAAGVFVKKWEDTDNNISTTADQHGKMWGLTLRKDGSVLSSVNDSVIFIPEADEGVYSVVEADSGQWQHIGVIVNGVTQTGDSISFTVAEGELSSIEFVNYYKPDTTKYRTFLSKDLGGKTIKMKYDKKLQRYKALPIPANVRDAALPKGGLGLTLGVARTDSPKAYGWITFGEGKNMASFFPGVGTKAYPFDIVRAGGKEKTFVKALKNPKAAKYENHLATELVAYRINEAASKTTPKVMSEGNLGDLLYNDPADTFGFNGMPVKRIADTANLYLTLYKRIPEAKRTAYFNALDSVFTRINREFYSGLIVASDTVPANGGSIIPLKIPSFKSIGEAVYFKSPLGKIEPDTPPQTFFAEPERFALEQNYPNPFNPATTIEFYLPDDAYVTLKVYNVVGQEIKTLFSNELLDAGTNEATLDASTFASGIYFYRMTAFDLDGNAFSSVRKMVLMK